MVGYGCGVSSMETFIPLKHRMLTGLSWRIEAKAASMSPVAGSRLRGLCGRMMDWAGAHNSLPAIDRRAAILCFHGVDVSPEPDVEDNVLDLRDFRRLLRVLNRSFSVISLAELVEAVRSGHECPPQSVVITFDDGYANNATIAANELDRYRMAWSAFLPTRIIEANERQWTDDVRLLLHRGRQRELQLHWANHRISLNLTTRTARRAAVQEVIERCRYQPDETRRAWLAELYEHYSRDELDCLREKYRSFAPMSWHQARSLQSAGVDVGSHGASHIALGPQSSECIHQELVEARMLLQERLGDHSPHFSYPYGRPASISDESRRAISEMGYHCALTLEQNVIDCQQADLLALPRLIVSPQVGRTLYALWQRFSV
jgi:peptidoglycan/xylan/chitin deacetylase (PgdA/CDA1 family)